MSRTYDTAFKLQTLGYSIIPAGANKAPIVQWQQHQDKPADEAQLKAWADELNPPLWGVVTNERVAVIDADTAEVRVELERELGPPHVITPRGGAHWYIDTSGHPCKTVAGLLPGLDIRGVGGFVVIVGSKYKVNSLPIPGDNLISWDKLPKRILAALNGSKPAVKRKQDDVIPDGQRNDTLTRIAGAMRRQGADQTAIEAALLNVKCQTPLPEDEIKAIAASVSRYEPQPDTRVPAYDWHNFHIEHNALLDQELPPIEFVVDKLFPKPGLCIIAGKKKIFKSFMCMQLSTCTSGGTPFIGFATTQGPVVHFALEDGPVRLQNRLKMQDAPRDLPIHYFYRITPLNTPAGIKELTEIIKEFKPVLVIIDTLRMAISGKLDENEAGANADLFNNIRKVATENGTTIILIAHHGKPKGTLEKDAGFDIRGSSAIPGVTDTNIGIYKNSDGTFEFIVEGRDIPEQELRLSFDKEITWAWQNEGDAVDLRRSEAESKIFEAIEELGGNVDAGQIANHIEVGRSNVQQIVKRLRNEKHLLAVVSNKRILYSTPITNNTNNTNRQTTLTTLTDNPSTVSTVSDVNDPSEVKYPEKPCVQCGADDPVLNEAMTAYFCKQCQRFYTPTVA